jgi:hypothetical protein
MPAFDRKKRQRIIDEYLAETGRNIFHPGEFVDWLSGVPDHEAWPWFFGQGDEEAARQHRISLARNMASGLRITAVVSTAPNQAKEVTVDVREFPALVSPVSMRPAGGGYVACDVTDPKIVAELLGQSAVALESWLKRYRGVAEMSGVDLTPIEEIVTQLRGDVVGAA